jgi:hypothetical protein
MVTVTCTGLFDIVLPCEIAETAPVVKNWENGMRRKQNARRRSLIWATRTAKESTQALNSLFASPNYLNTVLHDNEAPTKVGAMHTPSFVRIRWVDLLTGSTQAASRVSSVVKPERDRQIPKDGSCAMTL